jgi:spermidine/putrescine transport system permease protein
MQSATVDAPRISGRRLRAIAGLTGPAYFWLALTVFLPLSAMFYFSFLSDVPFGKRVAVLTLENYAAFFEKEFYRTLMLRSFRLGAEVTFYCFLFGFPCAYLLAKTIKGRSNAWSTGSCPTTGRSTSCSPIPPSWWGWCTPTCPT